MRAFLLSIIFLPISTILFSTLGLSCPVSVPTVSYVSKCPSNESEWESAAQQKQCNKLATLQKCTEPEKFVYHCVLNKDGTKYLEVCAQSWFMSGYCARFSVADGRIINDPGLDCTTFSTPCPSRFQSNESFKYQECYASLQQPFPSNIFKNVEKVTAETESNNTLLVGLLCVFVITTVLLAIFVAILKKKKLLDWCRTRREKSGELNDIQRLPCEEETPLKEEIVIETEVPSSTETKEKEAEQPKNKEENQASGSISPDTKEEENGATKTADTPAKEEAAAAKDSDEVECVENMSFRTLSGLRGVCSLKNVAIISDLRRNLSKELHKRLEDIWIVQEESGIIYNDETTFVELKKHQQHIEVMIGNENRFIPEEYGSTDAEIDVITNKFGASRKCRMTCDHLTEPENLFNYTKDKIMRRNAVVECPKCQASWEMEELLTKSDMSADEQIFFNKAMSINIQAKKKFHI